MRTLGGNRLVVASHNAGKIDEINTLLQPLEIQTVSAGELGLAEPEETGDTFEANAKLKAIAAASVSGLPALADDSGLAVDALGGKPGIHSARWAGPQRDFPKAMQNIENLLRQQGAHEPEQRGGRFIAVLCLAWPDGNTKFFRGEVNGTLIWPPRGHNGFGYDPMFQPTGRSITFGEMTPAEKHRSFRNGKIIALSHRSRAFDKFVRYLASAA